MIGMAVRFPGAPDVDTYWRNLRDGVCAVRPLGTEAGAAAGVLDDVDRFDAAFFGIGGREAEQTDPAHRIFLEVCQNALEHGGYAAREAARRVGVYAGSGMNLYGPQTPYHARCGTGAASGTQDEGAAARMQGLIGSQQDFLATRVAYRLGLTGAAVSVQSACSTSLVAVHLAAQSLLTGENDLALAGAAAVHLPQEGGLRHEPGFILSPSGVCRAFDAASDGTVGGSGVAAVLLKRLDRALADGDDIHAVLLGSAVNNDGDAKAGFTAPGVRGHVDAVHTALDRAGADPASVGYVEAHGTGTALGDRVEFTALARGYRRADGATGHCGIGSVKPSVGHLDTCAGMAGLVKTVLMLRHRTLVPTVRHTAPDPELPWTDSPFRLVTETGTWRSEGDAPLRAGVSALGFGGTNAHLVLEEPPPPPPRQGTEADARPAVLPLSAHSADALHRYARTLRDHLRAHPTLAAHDVAASLAAGRAHLPLRTVVHGADSHELADALDEFLDRATTASLARSVTEPAFAFCGQGVPVAGAALGWYHEHPAVRDVIDACEEALRADGHLGVRDLLLAPATAESARNVQQALFAVQLAQASLWRSYGIEPAAVLGHSLGELAALCVAGAFPVEDGIRFVADRGRIMADTRCEGRMLAVAADATIAAEVAAACGVDVAATNGPRSHVLSGPAHRIRETAARLTRQGVPCRELAVDRAFHSACLDAVLPELGEAAARIRYTPTHTPCGDSARARVLPVGTVVDADHLVRQARQRVRYADTLAAVHASGHTDFVELGPGDVLTRLSRTALPGTGWTPGRGSAAEVLGALYRHGIRFDWTRVTAGRRVSLPGRPFRGERFAVPDPAARPTRAVPPAPPATPAPDGAARRARVAVRQLETLGRLLDTSEALMAGQLRALVAARPTGPDRRGTPR